MQLDIQQGDKDNDTSLVEQNCKWLRAGSFSELLILKLKCLAVLHEVIKLEGGQWANKC